MGKLRQWFRNWFDRQIEKSMQRQADKLLKGKKMTQYDEKVELQKQILKAEEYKDTPKNLHAHSLDSMWYETEETKPQVKEGVMDIQYMDGRIERDT